VRYSLVQRGLIALVLVLAMAVWFSASAVVPALARQWHLSAAAAWLTAPVQAGFVLGAVVSAVLGLADRIGDGSSVWRDPGGLRRPGRGGEPDGCAEDRASEHR
jgi:MFS family permease